MGLAASGQVAGGVAAADAAGFAASAATDAQGVPVPDPMDDGIAIPTDQARQLLTDTGAFGAASIRGVALVANVASDGLGSIASTKLAEAGSVRDASLDLSTAGVAMGADVAVASQASTCTSVGALARMDACQAGSMGGVAIVQQAQLQA
ncbi:MAG: hypothetical protein LC624_10970, partial [Halobacteriales archaeon]|nr:hypothetical protein [Halobacteriales archaeon]